MNWADFKIAIAKGLVASAESVANIVSGATKVGNADKLDGNDSSYFATASSVTNITNGTTIVPKADTLDGYHASSFLQNINEKTSTALYFTKAATNGKSSIYKNNNAINDYGLVLKDENAIGESVKINIRNDLDMITFTNKANAEKIILHTGNSVPVIVSATAPSDTTAVWIVP